MEKVNLKLFDFFLSIKNEEALNEIIVLALFKTNKRYFGISSQNTIRL